jgi:peroxin-7
MSADPHPHLLRSDFACYSVKFSPFDPYLIAISTAQYYGIVGNGRQLICRITPGINGPIQILRSCDTPDGLYDVAWNEMNQNQMVSGDGGGGVKLWDMNTRDGFPIAMWKEHSTEVSSVDWNLQTKDCFLSASWDNTIKLWTPMSKTSIRTFTGHTYCVYQALWSPRKANVFISASGDHSVRVWDTNSPHPALVLAPAHDGEVLSVDWNKYNENVIATAGVDRTIRLWDLRNQRAPYLTLHGMCFHFSPLKNFHDFATVLTQTPPPSLPLSPFKATRLL